MERDSPRPDVRAYALGLAIAALTVFRRPGPLPVFLAPFVLLSAYTFFDYPGISPISLR